MADALQDDGRPPSRKIEKRPYRRNVLTDPHEIWHDDAYWPSKGYGQLKIPTFKNPRWQTAAILKKSKAAYISATAWPICMEFGSVTHISHPKGRAVKFSNF